MSLTLSSPKYSFVTVNETGLLPAQYTESEACFPIFDIDELVFQIKATTDNESLLTAVHILVDLNQIGDFVWTNIAGDDYIGVAHWTQSTSVINGISGGKCFVMYIDTGVVHININNCFYIVSDAFAAAQLQYFNLCDENDFHYSDEDFYNQIRLPMIMAFPEQPVKSKVYRQSRGRFKRTSSIMMQTWEVSTGWLTERQIICLSVAMQHDNIFIKDERGVWHKVVMPENEHVKPEWNKEVGIDFREAKVSFTVMEDFDSSISVLCGTCGYDYLIEEPIGGEL